MDEGVVSYDATFTPLPIGALHRVEARDVEVAVGNKGCVYYIDVNDRGIEGRR